jgi:hypothetical protein
MFPPSDNGMNISDALKILNAVKAKRKQTLLATVVVAVLGITASLLFLGAAVVLGSLSVYGLYHLGAWIL